MERVMILSSNLRRGAAGLVTICLLVWGGASLGASPLELVTELTRHVDAEVHRALFLGARPILASSREDDRGEAALCARGLPAGLSRSLVAGLADGDRCLAAWDRAIEGSRERIVNLFGAALRDGDHESLDCFVHCLASPASGPLVDPRVRCLLVPLVRDVRRALRAAVHHGTLSVTAELGRVVERLDVLDAELAEAGETRVVEAVFEFFGRSWTSARGD